MATLEGHSSYCALRRPLYFCDDLAVVGLRRRSMDKRRPAPDGRALRRRVWVIGGQSPRTRKCLGDKRG